MQETNPIRIEIDDSLFQSKLNEYASLNKRDNIEIVNKVARDVALTTARLIPKADREQILSVANTDWWIKYATKRLKKKQGTFTRKQLVTYAKRLVTARTRAIGFLRLAFQRAGASLIGGKISRPSITKAIGYGKRATDKPIATIYINYRNRNQDSAVRFATPYLQDALEIKRRDMDVYVRRKLLQNANKVNNRKR